MLTIYYRDIIEQEDFEINEDILLYLVCDAQQFALKAIKKNHLAKLPFDPLTRATEYWPIDLGHLAACEFNIEVQSKIFYREHDSNRLILSSNTLTRLEVNNFLKINPITDNTMGNASEENPYLTPIIAQQFNSELSSRGEFLSFITLVKDNLILESKSLFKRLERLMEYTFVSDSVNAIQNQSLISTLNLIQREYNVIQTKVDQLGLAFCMLDILYPDTENVVSIETLLSTRGLCSIAQEMISDKLNSLKSQSVNKNPGLLSISTDSTLPKTTHLRHSNQNIEQKMSQDELSSLSSDDSVTPQTTTTSCFTFFKNLFTFPSNNEVSYPYNRTRLRL